MKERCVFYYDIVCPFAYIASTLIEELESICDIKIIWQPIVLGGLYKSTNAPQGTNSATSILNKTKLAVTGNNFQMQLKRLNVKMNYPPPHLRTPIQKQPTLKVMRILCALPLEYRSLFSHRFYKARWIDNVDLTDDEVLQKIVDSMEEWKKIGFHKVVDVYSDSKVKEELKYHTDLASSRGAFGVPSFWIKERLFWGCDRMHFVARAAGSITIHPKRLQILPKDSNRKVNVKFFFDFSSPWSYLGSTQIQKYLSQTTANVTLEYVPILLGALFKKIGTPNMPALAMSEAKLAYSRLDFQDWVDYHQVDYKFSPHFPLRTVLPLRVVIAAERNGYDHVKLIHLLYRATWVLEKNIADRTVLSELLNEWNYPSETLFTLAESSEIKQILIDNTQFAENSGCCGVPSFKVDDNSIIWGQDQLNIVQDLVCGWNMDNTIVSRSSL